MDQDASPTTHLLENKLANVLVKQSAVSKTQKWRAFSHVTAVPDEVTSWVPVDLEELGDTVYFDERSCEAMANSDVTFYVATKRNVPFLHAVRVHGPAHTA